MIPDLVLEFGEESVVDDAQIEGFALASHCLVPLSPNDCMIEKERSCDVPFCLQALQSDVKFHKHQGVLLGPTYPGCRLYEGVSGGRDLLPG